MSITFIYALGVSEKPITHMESGRSVKVGNGIFAPSVRGYAGLQPEVEVPIFAVDIKPEELEAFRKSMHEKIDIIFDSYVKQGSP